MKQAKLVELAEVVAAGRSRTATVDALRFLVSRLDPRAARTLLKELARHDRQSPRVRQLREILIEQLNQQRPNRAQRLFTSLFELFLTRDLTLLTAPVAIPAVLTRPDVGALWHVLARGALKPVLPAIAAELAELSRYQLIEEAVLSDQALRRRAQMALIARDHIYRALATADRTRALATALNEARRGLLAGQDVRFGPHDATDLVRPLDRGDLQLMARVLRLGDQGAPHIAAALAATADTPLGDADALRQAGAIEKAQVATSGTLGPGKTLLSAAVPAMVLHVRAAYLPVALYIARRSFDPAATVAGEALLGHYSTCVQGLIVALRQISPASASAAADEIGVLVVDLDGRAFLDHQLDRFAAILAALQRAGLVGTQDRRFAALFRAPWAALESLVHGFLCSAALQRVTAVVDMPRFVAADHDDVVWLCRWIWRWRMTLADFDYASQELGNWRDQIGMVLDRGIQTCTRDAAVGVVSTDAAEAARLAHLAGLVQIYAALDLDPVRGFSATSRGMLRTCNAAFRRQSMSGTLPSADERLVIDAMVRLVRAEMEKTARSWVSSELAAFSQRASDAGY